MANELGRVKVTLSGFTGAPGIMYFAFQGSVPGTFSAADATAAVAAVRVFLASSASAFAVTVSMQVESAVEVVDWVTGALVAVRAATGVTAVAGSQAGTPLVAQGPLLQLYTSTVVGRRLLRGRLFFVPYAAGGVTGTGVVVSTVSVAVQAAANALISLATATWSIWHRPSPYSTGANGTVGAVTAGNMPAKVAVLRSRRD